MSKAQEKRDQAASIVAWNVKASADYKAAQELGVAADAFEEATDIFEATGAADEPVTTREERLVNDAYAKGEAEGRADALINRNEDELAAVDDMIHWITYKFPDTTMTTLEVLETLRDQINAGGAK